MVDSKRLTASLSRQAGILQPEQSVSNQKLQEMVGYPYDALSIFSQTAPQDSPEMLANSLSPIQGDTIFFTYLWPGARFQSHDGQWWEIDEYDGGGKVAITNIWYPRINAIVSVQDIRRSIYAWLEPVFQVVPPPPEGVNYGTTLVKVVE